MKGACIAAGFILAGLAAPAFAQQTTWCNAVGSTLACNTTAPLALPYPSPPIVSTYAPPTAADLARADRMAEANAEIAAFAKDPAHPHFKRLRARMAALLESGRATTLQQAYEMAEVEGRTRP